MKAVKKTLTAACLLAAMIVSGCNNGGGSGGTEIKVANYNVDDFVTLGEYKNFEIEYEQSLMVDDEEVEEEIKTILEENDKYEPITDRDTVAQNDYINLDYEGKLNGTPISGGTAKGATIQVGSAGFVEGFESQLVGKKIGTPFDITVKFPAEYPDTDIAGKDVVFTITVNAINKKIPATLNDEFVQSVSDESKTVAEFREETKKKLQEEKEETAKEYKQYYAETQAVGNAKVSGYPSGMVDKLVNDYKESIKAAAKEQGKEYKDYIKEIYDMEEADFDTSLKAYMEETAKITLVLEAIQKKENLTMSDSEMDEALKKYADENGFETKEEVFETYKEEDIKKYLQQMKVLDFIVDSSKLVEPKPENEGSSAAPEGSSEAPASSAAPSSSSGN
ncbi:MAG: trigger factor [Lachnospiraceae bacterium]|nr:trigger factor [Lachnospiraceae bacterium]